MPEQVSVVLAELVGEGLLALTVVTGLTCTGLACEQADERLFDPALICRNRSLKQVCRGGGIRTHGLFVPNARRA